MVMDLKTIDKNMSFILRRLMNFGIFTTHLGSLVSVLKVCIMS